MKNLGMKSLSMFALTALAVLVACPAVYAASKVVGSTGKIITIGEQVIVPAGSTLTIEKENGEQVVVPAGSVVDLASGDFMQAMAITFNAEEDTIMVQTAEETISFPAPPDFDPSVLDGLGPADLPGGTPDIIGGPGPVMGGPIGEPTGALGGPSDEPEGEDPFGGPQGGEDGFLNPDDDPVFDPDNINTTTTPVATATGQ